MKQCNNKIDPMRMDSKSTLTSTPAATESQGKKNNGQH